MNDSGGKILILGIPHLTATPSGKRFLCGLLIDCLIVLLGTGCASSDRMQRMSGGVFQEYAAPKSYRIRSQKFQAKTRSLEKAGKAEVGNIEGTPVNAWPFFFRSDYYTSMLWPFIDWDKYGFAVRPFYNCEGDEHAVLFPFSAWNRVNGDGWILLFVWNKHEFGFIPLCWQFRDRSSFWYYYTPFLIHHSDQFPLTLRKSRRSSFTELLLGYHYSVRRINWFSSYWKLTPHLSRYLAYRLDGTGIPVPRTDDELKKMCEDPEIAKKLPQRETQSFGFVPLFHTSYGSDGIFWRALAYLVGSESSPGNFEWDVLGPFIARYRNVRMGPYSLNRHRFFFSLPLLTYFTVDRNMKDEGKGKILKRLIRLEYKKNSFPERRFEIEADLKKLNPHRKLPVTVTDDSTYRQFLSDVLEPKNFPADDIPYHINRHGGFLPLFWYDTDERNKKQKFFTFAGMTFYGSDEKNTDFLSIPLLTYRKKRTFRSKSQFGSETFWIAPPLIWYSEKKEHRRNTRPIQPYETTWAPANGCTIDQSDFSVFGLYYRGRMMYYASKRGMDHKLVEDLRIFLPRYRSEAESIRKRIAAIRKEMKKLQKEIEAEQRKLSQNRNRNRILLLEKQLQHERESMKLEKMSGKKAELRCKIFKLQKRARSIGFEFDAGQLASGEITSVDSLLDELFRNCTELRSQSDCGSGFFYRRETFHNGDFHWRFMGILAGGRKNGKQEQCHVLQFLYRYRSDGNKMEKIYFPFISIREDGRGRRFSFLGRVYQRTESQGKSSGYFLFIPF